MPNPRQLFFLFFFFATATLLPQDTFAQSNKPTAKEKKFAEQFWSYLLSNNYKHWSPPAGKTADHFASQIDGFNTGNPHGASMKMYVNRTAAGNPDSLPIGSVLIVENYRTDKSLDSISVMYRTKGFNPKANDWYWANYKPDGTIASQKHFDQANGVTLVSGLKTTYSSTGSPKKLMGRVQSCIQCHQSGGNDLAFFNNNRSTQTRAIPASNRVSTSQPINTTAILTNQNASSAILGNQVGNIRSTTLNQIQPNSFSGQ